MQKINLADNESVKAEREILVNAQLKVADLESELNDHRFKLNKPSDLNGAAEKYLEEGLNGGRFDLDKVRLTIRGINEELYIAKRAIELQKKKVQDAEAIASREVCEKVYPEYHKIQNDLAKALLHLMEIVKQERNFHDSMREGGVSFSGVQMNPFTPAGGCNGQFDSNSPVCFWFKSGIYEKYIKASDVPQPWRTYWSLEYVAVKGDR